MDNEFMDDDENEEIIDFEAEYIFNDPAFLTSSDESNAPSEQTQPSSNNHSRTTSESASVSGLSVSQLNVDDVKMINEFSLEKHTKELCSKIGTGDLVTCLNKHWQKYVPICFSATDVPTRNLIETDVNKILLKPLEVYLCNNIESDKILAKLSELDDPPQLCGRVFKAGEPSYFCRDCGSDPTCVLCSNCFRKSKHREHRYKMTTSSGGGYCDCGDPEAWKKFPNCELHMPKSKSTLKEISNEDSTTSTNNSTIEDGWESLSEEYISKLPKDLVQRATELFSYLLEYIFEVLSIENSQELPSHLKPETVNDDYVTMLYNDEVHSYEQVVSTLRKVLSIDEKKAYEYAAIVDKEGRSTIKRAKKTECTQIKTKVETTMGGPLNNSLETKLLHHSLVAHQYFGEKILVWLQKICDTSKGLKHILCKVGLFTKPDNHSVIEKIMLSDSIFWKSVRAITHQFFIAIYFMDPLWKREFAVLYTKNYKLIWRNHVKNPDDTVSLTDLAVQMFTVISLSKYLLKNYNLLQTIMETLIEHSKTNKGKLSFPRTRQRNNPEFKRAQYMLFDLKYCLTAAPNSWDDQLRKSFINGFKAFIEFIKFMHGMDALRRQTQQHIEFEPEWETSFNLLIKLQKSISSLIDWCSSDKVVYFECYKYLLNAIHQVEANDSLFTYTYDKCKLNGTSYEIIDYSILKQEVSIHAPLTRLFAAIYPHLSKFSLNFTSILPHLQSSTLNHLSSLKHDLPKQKIINLLEPSIRALILVSQTNAGLWKRNGFSLLSQVYFYSNIKCRQEMFDRDILCLQMGASIIDPNEFLVNLLSRYGLFAFFTDDNFELPSESTSDDLKLEYLLPLSEDFLELLIQVVSERYEPFISQIDSSKRLERECIHQLCVSPMAHSDLVKNVYPDNEKYTNDLETVLANIATFRSSAPSSNSKGVYELKPEYYVCYSPYFYHYTRSEKTKSEEYQLSLKKSEKEKFFKPPKLPALSDLYKNMRNLLDSDVFVRIVFTTLRRIANKSKYGSDGQLVRILHLIGLALHEEQDDIDKKVQKESSFKFLEKSFINKNHKRSLEFLVKLSSKNGDHLTKYINDVISVLTTDSYKYFCEWILDYSQKILKIKHKIDGSISSNKTEADNENEVPNCSTLANETETAQLVDEQTQAEKRKHEIAEKRRAKIMAKLNKMQKNFIENNQEFYDETKTNSSAFNTYSSCGSESEVASMNFDESELLRLNTETNTVVCIGPNQSMVNSSTVPKQRYQCILCQEDDEISLRSSPMVLCCYVTSSKVLSKNRMDSIKTGEEFDAFDPLYLKNTLNYGIATTSCGHVMHAKCWQKYVETVRLAENRRHARYHGFNIKRNEYLCPLCETIGNSVLPIFPNLNEFKTIKKEIQQVNEKSGTIQHDENSMDLIISAACSSSSVVKSSNYHSSIELSYEDWIDGLGKTVSNSFKKDSQINKDNLTIIPCTLSSITKQMTEKVASNFKSLFEFDSLLMRFNSDDKTKSENLQTIDLIENFTRASYTFGFSTHPNDQDPRMAISIWLNCSYTITVIEQLLRVEEKLLFGHLTLKQADLLSNIVKQAGIYGVNKNTEAIRRYCVRLLAFIISSDETNELKSILEIDMFYLLVSLCFSMPNLFADASVKEKKSSSSTSSALFGGLNDFHIFKLVLQAHCVQILLTKIKLNSFIDENFAENDNVSKMELDNDHTFFDSFNTGENDKYENESSLLLVKEFFNYVLDLVKVDFERKNSFNLNAANISTLSNLTSKCISITLKHALMPFLRCTTLFFSNLTGLVPSIEITNKPGNLNKNFNALISFLGVENTLGDLLNINSSPLKSLCYSWISKAIYSDQLEKLNDYPMKINKFIELPNDFVDLISMSQSSHVCSLRVSSLVDTSSESATILCLICGEMLCSQALCCQEEIFKNRVGCCTAHAYKCSGSVGLFLRVSECQVLMLHLNIMSKEDFQVRGCFLPAPYLDDYGETDMGLRRGNPLRLCILRFKKLYKDWLSHAIPEEVSRSFQNQTTNIMSINWHEL